MIKEIYITLITWIMAISFLAGAIVLFFFPTGTIMGIFLMLLSYLIKRMHYNKNSKLYHKKDWKN